jgi:hypothetical protein
MGKLTSLVIIIGFVEIDRIATNDIFRPTVSITYFLLCKCRLEAPVKPTGLLYLQFNLLH